MTPKPNRAKLPFDMWRWWGLFIFWHWSWEGDKSPRLSIPGLGLTDDPHPRLPRRQSDARSVALLMRRPLKLFICLGLGMHSEKTLTTLLQSAQSAALTAQTLQQEIQNSIYHKQIWVCSPLPPENQTSPPHKFMSYEQLQKTSKQGKTTHTRKTKTNRMLKPPNN